MRVRQRLLPRRLRRLTEKHLHLAVFAAERPTDKPLSAQMAIWNDAHPEWPYSQITNFGRDLIQAQRRVLDYDDTHPASRALSLVANASDLRHASADEAQRSDSTPDSNVDSNGGERRRTTADEL